MEEIFCNSAFAHILESIFLHLEPQDLKNCRKVNTNFKNVLDQPFLWLKIYQAKGIFEQSQNFNLWETLVKLTNRTTLGKNGLGVEIVRTKIVLPIIVPPKIVPTKIVPGSK